MVKVKAKTRQEWVRVSLKAGRVTPGTMKAVIVRQEQRGLVTAMPAEGPSLEQIAFVPIGHPLVQTVREVADGNAAHNLASLMEMLGGGARMPRLCTVLARVGLAMAEIAGMRVTLRPADPRAAKYINNARLGETPRGYKVQHVIAAFLPIARPGRKRLNVTDLRRLRTAEALHYLWRVECDDILNARKRVRLRSAWLLPVGDPPGEEEARKKPYGCDDARRSKDRRSREGMRISPKVYSKNMALARRLAAKNGGILPSAWDLIQCGHEALYRWLHRHPEHVEELRREGLVDEFGLPRDVSGKVIPRRGTRRHNPGINERICARVRQELRELTTNGRPPTPRELIRMGRNDLAAYMRLHPDRFAEFRAA